jgi:ElaB/YqjD/DUF883 family membrane-anchored ribosome-binding protein
MTREEKTILQHELTQLIDRESLRDVLQALTEVSRKKANQCRSQWQESLTAKRWDLDANIIATVATEIFN